MNEGIYNTRGRYCREKLSFSVCITYSCNRGLAQVGLQDCCARQFVWQWDVDELV